MTRPASTGPGTRRPVPSVASLSRWLLWAAMAVITACAGFFELVLVGLMLAVLAAAAEVMVIAAGMLTRDRSGRQVKGPLDE